MANTVWVKTGDILEITYNDVEQNQIELEAINLVTGFYVLKIKGNPRIQTNITANKIKKEYRPSEVDSINGVAIVGANPPQRSIDLYNKIRALL